MPVHKFLIEGKKQIPNLVGVKFTHNNLMEMQQCIHADGGAFEVLHGFDETINSLDQRNIRQKSEVL